MMPGEMDCSNVDGELWDWQGDDWYLQEEPNLGVSHCLWDGTDHNENFSNIFDESTPAKDCKDLTHNATGSEKVNVGPQEPRLTYSQVKRRRMLRFNSNISDPTLHSEDMPSDFLTSREMIDSIEGVLADPSQWISRFPDASASGYIGLNHSSEEWSTECFDDGTMHVDDDDMYVGCSDHGGLSGDLVDITEYCDIPSECEADMIPVQAAQVPQDAGFKGRKASTMAASSIAYPFSFIKPCAIHGDVTLKDINGRIRKPAPSKLKGDKEGRRSGPCSISAVTGKQVVGKTKIRTDRGEGSITIMRTKG